MGQRLLVIQGHPDVDRGRFCHALADAYVDGAHRGGREVRRIDVAQIAFPWIAGKEEFEHGEPPVAIRAAQDDLRWCDHVVIIHPLWLGMMPALLKAFLEQVLRPGFSHRVGPRGWERLLRGRSARVVVTMGMPALAYRWWFGAHGLKALRRSILGFCGFAPVRETLIGLVESPNAAARERWLVRLRQLGERGL